MGWFSSVVNAVRGVVRDVVNFAEELVGTAIGAITSIFLFWATKKIRVRVCILHKKGGKPIVGEQEVKDSMDRLDKLLRKKYNVKVLTYGAPHIYTIPEAAPDSAMSSECSFSGGASLELGDAGAFFSQYADNIPLVCPITAFIVEEITNGSESWRGCSSWVLTNYVLLTEKGLTDDTTFAHEISHACYLQHRKKKENLLYHGYERGTKVTGWQKWWFRASRHVNYW